MDRKRSLELGEKVPTKVRILLTASFFSALATVGQITIVGKQVYDMTGSELNLGLLGLAEFLPVALLSPFTGPVADRFDRRKVFSFALVHTRSQHWIFQHFLQVKCSLPSNSYK